MSEIRQQAIEMIEKMPEEKIYYIIDMLKKMEEPKDEPKQEGLTKAQIAFRELAKYRVQWDSDRDYREELYEALEEKYASLN